MLTKDLIRVRLSGDSIKPMFISVNDPELLSFCGNLVMLYNEGEGSTVSDLDEAADAIGITQRDRKLADGLHKIVRDRAEFSPVADCDYPAARVELFHRAADLIRRGAAPADLDAVRGEVFANAPAAAAPLSDGIYCDLPERERLLPMKKLLVREVPERYNTALVQSLLLFASDLTVSFPAQSEPAALRRLFKYLKFFRLLFSAEMRPQNVIRLVVDGPASVLEHSAKYGLQLASFFPAVCLLPHWKIEASVLWKDRPRSLKLDESSGLVSHYANFSAYQPEEIRMFAAYFKQGGTGWTIDDMPGWISLGGQSLLFPDFVFHAADGRAFPLELFHRWHYAQVEKRLAWCEENPDRNLLLGVDRALLKKDGILKERLDASAYFQTHGFLFRDFPGVENTVELLDSLK